MSFQFLTGVRLTQVLHLPPNLKTMATPMTIDHSFLPNVIRIMHCNGGGKGFYSRDDVSVKGS